MIGRLLQSAATTFIHHGSSTPPQAPLESVTEEAHTRDLLFPDLYARRLTRADGLPPTLGKAPVTPKDAASFDDRGGLDIEHPSDVRIIIAQDANSRYQSPQILFDSKCTRSANPPDGGTPRESDNLRKSNFAARGKSATNPLPTGQRRDSILNNSPFSRPQAIATSPLSPRVPEKRLQAPRGQLRQDRSNNDIEAEQAKTAKEDKEDTDDILSCVFGAAGFRLEASTKLHIIPRKSIDPSIAENRSPPVLRPFSSGEIQRKRTSLFRSASAISFHESNSSGAPSENSPSYPTKPAIMFTRLFNINLSDTSDQSIDSSQSPQRAQKSQVVDSTANSLSNCNASPSTIKDIRQKKAPMYAVTILLQLPDDGMNPQFHAQSSLAGTSILTSSPNEAMHAASWRTHHSHLLQSSDVRAGFVFDPALKTHLSYVLSHWNVLSRSMELLEMAARCKLGELLEAIPLPPKILPPPVRNKSGKSKGHKQPVQQSIYVPPECLQNIASVQREAEAASKTVVEGMRTRRVVTGQNRWGAWKEEARWVSRWAGNRDQNFFFYNILTAFLGSHSAWLRFLSPTAFRRRAALQYQTRPRSSSRIEQRTVIVCSDKMAARRLLFLLATFLPSSSVYAASQVPVIAHDDRPHTGHSPVSSSINNLSSRRTAPFHTHQAQKTLGRISGHSRSVSFSIVENGKSPAKTSPTTDARRGSDARSFRTPSLAIPNRSQESRKASVSTLLVDSDPPVPHFTNPPTIVPSRMTTDKMFGIGDSLASVALTQNLKRSGSISASPVGTAAHWGSVASGFSWGQQMDSATETSEDLSSPHASMTDQKSTKNSPTGTRPSKLTQMVDEAESLSEFGSRDQERLDSEAPVKNSQTGGRGKKRSLSGEGSSVRNVPSGSMAERMPLKLSFNEDGFLDVSLSPGQSWPSSLTSSFGSSRVRNPDKSDPHGLQPDRGSFVTDLLSQQSYPIVEAAGWLEAYHPCFELQAVKPYEALIEEIKASMYAESKLVSPADSQMEYNSGEWLDICATLIANTTTFTIERLRLLKRRRPQSFQELGPDDASLDDSSYYEEKLITEPVMDMDSILTDAIERLLIQSGGSSRAHSRAPSPKPAFRSASNSRNASRQGKPLLSSLGGQTSMGDASSADCEKAVLAALQEVIRGVVEEIDGGSDIKNRRRKEPDSTLKEGVRKWLKEFEENS